MTGNTQALLAGFVKDVVKSFTPWSVMATGLPGSNRGCTFSLNRDGSFSYTITAGSDTTTKGTPGWFNQVGGTPGDGYSVRATLTSGSAAITGTVGAWLPLNATQTWAVPNGTTGQSSTLLFEIAPFPANTPVLASLGGNVIGRGNSP